METFPGRIASKLSILSRSISAFLRHPPPPVRLVGSGSREGPGKFVATSFSIPGTTWAPGRSSWSREFESRGTPRFEPSLVVLRSVLKRVLD